jgi:hypothetical protein
MAHDLIYAPSGYACHLDDECRDCRGVEFPGEVVMVYDPAARDLYVICEACYRRRLDLGRAGLSPVHQPAAVAAGRVPYVPVVR